MRRDESMRRDWRRLGSRRLSPKTGGKVAAHVLRLLLVAVAALLLGCQHRQEPFTSTAWQRAAHGAEGAELRGRMTEDLLRSHLTPRMTRRAVLSILGPPDYPSTPEQEKICYVAGKTRALLDGLRQPLYLILEFDDADLLVAKSVVALD